MRISDASCLCSTLLYNELCDYLRVWLQCDNGVGTGSRVILLSVLHVSVSGNGS